jgi:hypothetical protein
MKTIKGIFIITLPTVILILVILELFFRIVIPACNPPLTVFDYDNGLTHYSTEKPQGLYTIGKFAQIRSKWKINNDGWNYPIDYKETRGEQPLIAVIGDSFIEAFQVSSGKNYPYLLREKLSPENEVYAFGLGGIPLSQYYNVNRYVNNKFNPEIVIINLTHTDFEESFSKYFHRPGIWQIAMLDSVYTLVPPDLKNISPTNTFWKKALYGSATFRYLHRNLYIFQLFKQGRNAGDVEANVKIVTDVTKQSEIFQGMDFLVEKIKLENEGRRVILIFDASRGVIYDGTLDMSKVKWMYDMVSLLSSKYDMEYIDLTLPMQQDYAKNRQRFNSELDNHWNEYGHEFIANLLYEYLTTNPK